MRQQSQKMSFDHFQGNLDPAVAEKFPNLTDEEIRFCADTAMLLFITLSGCWRVIGEDTSVIDLNEVIIRQLRIHIYG